MLLDSKLTKKFWVESVSTAAYVRNRNPTTTAEGWHHTKYGKTTNQMWVILESLDIVFMSTYQTMKDSKWICGRKNFKLLSGAGIFWLFCPELIFSTNENISCHSARVTSRATIKRRGNILSPSSMQAFRAGQTCQHERVHILSHRFLAAGRTSQHKRPHSLFFTNSSSLTLSHILRAVR